MANLLDLSKKVQPQVKVIYHTITAPRPWYVEITKVLAVIAIVTTIVWGISKADELISQPEEAPAQEIVGVYGTVENISTTTNTLSLINTQGTEYTGHSSFIVLLNNLQKVETNEYLPLTLSDIQAGDTIIARGTINEQTIDAESLISFTFRPILATTTLDLATTTATTTDLLATTTEDISSTTSTTTPGILEQIGDAIGDIVDNIIDLFNGTSTPTTTPETSTTTPETSTTTPETSTTTPEVVEEPEVTPPATTTPEVTEEPAENITEPPPTEEVTLEPVPEPESQEPQPEVIEAPQEETTPTP
jgi:hypothetical protein